MEVKAVVLDKITASPEPWTNVQLAQSESEVSDVSVESTHEHRMAEPYEAKERFVSPLRTMFYTITHIRPP